MLNARAGYERAALERAAWAGLQDSMPRAAVASIHARVEETRPDAWEDPAYIQVWGPRFNAYVIAARDRAVFTVGRLTDDPAGADKAYGIAGRLRELLGDEITPYREAGRALGMNPNQLRYAAPTGTVLIRWEGSGAPLIWTVPPPEVDPIEARLELARRYLHVLGPGTPASFSDWAGIKAPRATAAFQMLEPDLTPVETPIGDRWILTSDSESFRAAPVAGAPVRLLPSGDSFWLLYGNDRELLVPDPRRRGELWTPRVWPGAILIEAEVTGIWRRSAHRVTIAPWRELSGRERAAVEAEAASLPIPGTAANLAVTWEA